MDKVKLTSAISDKWASVLGGYDMYNTTKNTLIDTLYNATHAQLTHYDANDAAMNVFPIARKVYAKTIGSDLVDNAYNNYDGVVSYKVARVLYEKCHYQEPSRVYYADSSTAMGYSIRTEWREEGFVNSYYDKNENFIGVNSEYAAPQFQDVLIWLGKDDNYSKYSSCILTIKDYLYDNKLRASQPLNGPSGLFHYMDFKDPSSYLTYEIKSV